jgi:putative transposase
MLLTESHIINSTNELNDLSFKCKNLYNKANYIIRQEFITNGKYLSKFTMFNIMKDIEEYKALPVRVSRGVLRTLDANWLSFFSCIKKWKTNKSLFKGKPNLPKYLDKNGKFTALFYENAILKPTKKINKIGLSSLKLRLNTNIKYENIVEIQVVPTKTDNFKIHIIYDYKEEQLKNHNNLYCGIDLGINNLMTLTSNKKGLQPLVVNGRPLKSINQFYNKTKAKYQSQLPKNIYTSKKINKLTFKRENKVKDYLQKASNMVMKYCLENNINTIILGYNVFWKQKVNLGVKTNQNFVSIPFEKLKFMLEYKCKKHGLHFILNEESYTSKCSFLDNEVIDKREVYKGKRISRGLFRSSNGRIINADVNGSYNIIRKVFSESFKGYLNGNEIEGLAVHPYRINL